LVADPTHLQYSLRDFSMVGENRLRWKILVYAGGYLSTGRETRLRSGIHVKGKGYSSKQKGRLVYEGGYSSTDWQTIVYCKKYSSTGGGSTKGVGRSSAEEGCSSTEGILVFGGEDSSTEH
jgi:hypothetical protein